MLTSREIAEKTVNDILYQCDIRLPYSQWSAGARAIIFEAFKQGVKQDQSIITLAKDISDHANVFSAEFCRNIENAISMDLLDMIKQKVFIGSELTRVKNLLRAWGYALPTAKPVKPEEDDWE